MYAVPTEKRSPFRGSFQGIALERSSLAAKSRAGKSGAMWSTANTTAGKDGGSSAASAVSAANPPAEAPITTMRGLLSGERSAGTFARARSDLVLRSAMKATLEQRACL